MRRCVVLVFCLLLIPSGLAAQSFELRGYDLWLSCTKKGNKLFLEGRISHGPVCQTMRIDALVENSAGEQKRVKAWVRDVGGFGSRLVEGKIRAGAGNGSWRINDVELRCTAR